MGKKPRGPKRTPESLTEAELELMNIVWRAGPSTVAEVMEALPSGRDLAYTSVSTIIRILEQKGFVTSHKEGRGHRYQAAVAKEAFQATSIKHLISNVFDGTPAMLVRRLLTKGGLSLEEVAEIKALLAEKEQ